MVAEGGEGENPLPAPKQGGWGGGGVGGRHPRLRQAPTTRFAKRSYFGRFGFLWGKGPRPLAGRAPSPGGPGPKPPGDLAHRPLGPGSRHSHDFLQAKFLTSCCVSNPWVRATITPNPLTLGGVGWFPKAELYSSMRGGVPVFAPAFQPLGRAPSPCAPGQQAPEPCIPVKNSKNAPVLIGS